MSILFNDMVFGPVHSRRLGLSLGINLLSPNKKVCTFNCIYCECGWTEATAGDRNDYYERTGIKNKLNLRLCELLKRAVDARCINICRQWGAYNASGIFRYH